MNTGMLYMQIRTIGTDYTNILPGLYCSEAALFKPMITPSINASITAP